jgi:mono/diheme cytochrome c family protein
MSATISTPETSPAVVPPGGLPAARRLPGRQRAIAFGTPVVLLAAAWGLPTALYFRAERPGVATAAVAGPDGPALFNQHCATCHGVTGNGVGTTYLDPPARNFGEGKFRLATTTNGVASDDDLRWVLRRGIPGSAMPGYPQLSDAEVAAVIDHVRTLTRTGVYDRLRKKAEEDGDADLAELAAAADRMSRPGDPVDVPPLAEPTPESVARGRQVYATTCAQCHGPEGRGDGPQVKDLKNDNGWPTRPRDLTAGVFKGGGEPERLYARLVLGMPGTPMPASSLLPPTAVADLVHFVRSLSAPAADSRAAAGPEDRSVAGR